MNDQRKTEKQMLGDLEQKRELVIREQGISMVLQNVSNKVAEAKRQTESRPGTIRPRNNRYNTRYLQSCPSGRPVPRSPRQTQSHWRIDSDRVTAIPSADVIG